MSSDGPHVPAIPDVGILSLSSDRWEGTWQSQHQILSRLAKFFPVVWFNPPLPREQFTPSALRQQYRSKKKGYVVPGLTSCDPIPWLPMLCRPQAVATWNAKRRLHIAAHILRRRGCRKIIIYLWRPQFAKALDLLEHDLSCYHVADEYSFSSQETPTLPTELRLLQRADQVFIRSPALMDKKGTINSCTMELPNGVDFAAFSRPAPEPTDMAAVPYRRIG